jgi:hypothetical protein
MIDASGRGAESRIAEAKKDALAGFDAFVEIGTSNTKAAMAAAPPTRLWQR